MLTDEEPPEALPDALVRQAGVHLHRRGDRERDEDHPGQEDEVEQGLGDQLAPEAERRQPAVQIEKFDRANQTPHHGDGEAGKEIDPQVHLDRGVWDTRRSSSGGAVRDGEHLVNEEPDQPERQDSERVAPGSWGEA